ncbi:MAG: VOC family protein [Candidatus Sericytochromatia bacterium]
MSKKITSISLIVNDYDEALDFYINKLNFTLIEDTQISFDKRWVLICPNENKDFSLLLAKASNDEQKSRIGNQTGGRVFLFLETDNFYSDYQDMINKDIKFIREPVEEEYGIVAVFSDLYGNLWDLIQRK